MFQNANVKMATKLSLFSILFVVTKVFAQIDYPNKPISFIVPYGAGGGADSRRCSASIQT